MSDHVRDPDLVELDALLLSFGKPVVMRVEHTISRHYDEDDSLPDDIESETYDVAKLLHLDENSLRYVEHILKAALTGAKESCSVSREASVKYSFRDCPDWYAPAAIQVIPEGAVVIDVFLQTDMFPG